MRASKRLRRCGEGIEQCLLNPSVAICLCTFLTSKDVTALAKTNSTIYHIIEADVAGSSDDRADTYTQIKLPLSYCSLEERKGNFVWLPSNQALKGRHGGLTISHLILDSSFHRLPPSKQINFLWSCNYVRTLTVDSSFFECPCAICSSLRPTAKGVCVPQSGGTPMSPEVAEAPPVFASYAVATGAPSSPSLSSDESSSPAVATVEADSPAAAKPLYRPLVDPTRLVSLSVPPVLRKQTATMHAFQKLTLVFQIAYRNRSTLQSLDVNGPAAELSTALMRDDELPKLPFPLKRRIRLSEAGKQPFFEKLQRCAFGSTVDCRYVVPFLDYSDFACLRSVSVGRLTAQYVFSEPQFGEKSTVVFAPQHIFERRSFPAAPHLPAIYNGAIDENLRFQGRGIFVCDEYTYEGDFKDGVNNGYGHMKSSAGEMYIGEWRHGQRNGRGRVVQLTGDSLAGNWVNDSLGGFGTLKTADGFAYIGNWLNSRFEGWGTIWYKEHLLCYGRFSRGFLSGWSRMLRWVPDGLCWEEGEHDDFGRASRCFQITLTLPRWDPETRELRRSLIHAVRPDNLDEQRAHFNSFEHCFLSTPPRIRDPSPAVEHHVTELQHFRHDFPDEDSSFHDDASPAVPSPPASTDCCMSPVALSGSPTPMYVPSPSPVNQLRPFESITSSLDALDGTPPRTPSDWNASRNLAVEVASPANRAETGLTMSQRRPRVDGSSRSRAALLQCIETVDYLHKHTDPDAMWDLFAFWDRTFYKHIHSEWLRTDLLPHQRKVASPLNVPLPEEVPGWLRHKIWQHYGYAE